MADDVGLDVSDRDTAIHVVDEGGRRVWRGKRAGERARGGCCCPAPPRCTSRSGRARDRATGTVALPFAQAAWFSGCLPRCRPPARRQPCSGTRPMPMTPSTRRRSSAVRGSIWFASGVIATISPASSSRPRSRSAIGSCVPVARRAAGRRRFRHPPMLTSWSVCAARCGSSGRSAFFAAAGFLHLAVVLDAWSRKIPRVRLRPPEGRLGLVDGPPSTHRAGAGRARRGGD